MGAKRRFLLGAVLVAVAALSWTVGRGGATPSVGPPPEALGQAPAPAALDSPDGSGGAPLLARAAVGGRAPRDGEVPRPALPPAYTPAARPAGLYSCGLVVDLETGSPAPGARVEAVWIDGRGNPGETIAATTTADDTGHYLLPCPAERPFQRRVVRARLKDRASWVEPILPCEPQRIELRRAVTVSGQVLDSSTGRAVAGAAVLAWGPPVGRWWYTCASGDDGRFRFVVPRDGLAVSAWQEGYAFTRQEMSASSQGDADLLLRLAPASTRLVRGRLVAAGRPVAGGLVELVDVNFGVEREAVASVRSDGDGGFDLTMVVGRDYALQASLGDERAFDIVRAGDAAGDAPRELVLLPALALVGRVTRGGAPVADARVVLVREAPRAVLETRTDAAGRYRFEDVRRPRWSARLEVRATAPDGGSASAWADVAHAADREVEASALEMPRRRVRGHVRDVSGHPIVRAVVRAEVGRDWVTTDEEGRYEIALPDDPRGLEASAPGFVTDCLTLRPVAEDATWDATLRLEGDRAAGEPDGGR